MLARLRERSRQTDAIARSAIQGETLLEASPRRREIPLIVCNVAQVQERLGDALLVAETAPQREALLVDGARARVIRLVERKNPLRIERIGIGAGACGVRRERANAPCASEREVAALEPEGLQQRAKPLGDVEVCARDAPVEGGAKVLALTVEPRKPLRLVGAPQRGLRPHREVDEVLAVPLMNQLVVRAFVQALLRELANGLEHLEPALRIGLDRHQQTLADERFDGRDDIAALRPRRTRTGWHRAWHLPP